MKKIGILSVAALLLGGIAFTACKKYEEGPSLTVLTKTQRLSGSWEVEAYLENGVDKTSDYRQAVSSETFTMEKDGAYTMSMTWTIGGSLSDSGTWEFINDKEDVKTLSSQTGATPDTIHITRLKNKEFWTKEVSGNNTYEYHYKAK